MKPFDLRMLACVVLLAHGCGGQPPCGAAPGAASRAVTLGLRRDAESVAAMEVLGLHWSADPRRSEVLLLGYPDLGLTRIASAESPWSDDAAGLHHTYADDFHGA